MYHLKHFRQQEDPDTYSINGNILNPVIFNADKLTYFKSKLAEIKAGLQEIINVNLWGDSITAGGVAVNGGLNNLSRDITSMREMGWGGQLNSKFAKAYGDVRRGLLTSSYYSNSNLTNYSNPVWTFSGTWNPLSSWSFGQSFYNAIAGSYISTPFQGTGVDVFTLVSPSPFSGGSIDVYIDGGLNQNISTTEAGNVSECLSGGYCAVKTSITGLQDGGHVIKLQVHDNNPITILGICETGGTSGVRVNNMGFPGDGSGRATSASLSYMKSQTFWNAALTVIGYGVNDYAMQVDTSEYKTNIQTMITAAKETGDVILLYPSARQDSTQGTTYPQSEYLNALSELADENDVCFINMYTALNESNTYANQIGYIPAANDVHPGVYGHSILAKVLFNVMTN